MSAAEERCNAEFPEILAPLFKPRRYKILYGGRGASRSWSCARALLILGAKNPLRILCARELQKSIKDSVHRLLGDQIDNLGLGSFYKVQEHSIKGRNGTEFFFAGLRHNSAQIKSYEGIDIVWIEEALTTSKSSWDYLIPTIRKAGSEIWVTFNPELEEDETYQRFVIHTPEGAFIAKMNYKDNPWFPLELEYEMQVCKERSIDDYNTIWLGNCRQAVQGAIYAKEIEKAHNDGRICSVPYNPALPVHTFWDLGYADNTSIWFVQKVGLAFHAIDFYQNSRKGMPFYVERLKEKGYVYGQDHLPHDGRSHGPAIGVSCEEVAVELGREVAIVPRQDIQDGINASRLLFEACYFDKVKCADGLQALRRYKYEVNKDTGRESKSPLHDENSHGADAFRTFATAKHVAWSVVVEPMTMRGNEPKMKFEYDISYK